MKFSLATIFPVRIILSFTHNGLDDSLPFNSFLHACSRASADIFNTSPFLGRTGITHLVVGETTQKQGKVKKMAIYQPGQVVYVMIRNPHVQGVANVQEAAVVQNPDSPGELALFLYETYYPLTDEIAVYLTESEAEQAYIEVFGSAGEGEYYG